MFEINLNFRVLSKKNVSKVTLSLVHFHSFEPADRHMHLHICISQQPQINRLGPSLPTNSSANPTLPTVYVFADKRRGPRLKCKCSCNTSAIAYTTHKFTYIYSYIYLYIVYMYMQPVCLTTPQQVI